MYKEFFVNKGWTVFDLHKRSLLFSKTDGGLKNIVTKNTKTKAIDMSAVKAFKLFKDKTTCFFLSILGKLNELQPKNIFDGFGNNSFVGSGREVFQGHFYNNEPMPKTPSIIYQPSVRLRFDFIDINYDACDPFYYSSIAFTNVSIINIIKDEKDYVISVDNMISYLSSLGIYADRIKFVVSGDFVVLKNTSLTPIIFYVDDLEVADVVFIHNSNTKQTFVEYGFSFERVAACVLKTNYIGLMAVSDHHLAILSNFFVLLSASGYDRINKGAKSKLNNLREKLIKYSSYDSYSLLRNFYDYWEAVDKNIFPLVYTLDEYQKIIKIADE